MKKSASANGKSVVTFRADNFMDKLAAAAARENMTVGKWVKQQILTILENDDKTDSPVFNLANRIDDGEKKRVSVSLTPSEIDSINKLMEFTKTKTVSKMILAIIRAYLINLPIFSNEEIIELRQATIALQTIGRNINHIAVRYASGTVTEEDKFTQQELKVISDSYINYSNTVNKLLVTIHKRYCIKQ